MARVTILSRTYELPDTPVQLKDLKLELQAGIDAVRKGEVERAPALLGLLRRPPQRLTPDERFERVQELVRSYDRLIDHLHASKDDYLAFFRRLSLDIESAVSDKAAEIREIEAERNLLAQKAAARDDDALAERMREREERHKRLVRTLGCAALLLEKKLALCHRAISSLTDDQQRQRAVLDRLREELEVHRREWALEVKTRAIEHDVEQMAQVALHFEGYVREYFGPLQDLLEEVSEVDIELNAAVMEIEGISQLLREETRDELPALGRDEELLDLLVSARMRQARLDELVEQMGTTDDGEAKFEVKLVASTASVDDALTNIAIVLSKRMDMMWSFEVTCADCGAVSRVRTGTPGSAWTCDACAERKAEVARTVVSTIEVRHPVTLDAFGDEVSSVRLVEVPPGTFAMGDNHRHTVRRTVRLTHPFAIGVVPVTQALYLRVTERTPSHFEGLDRPVENVTWFDAVRFCNALSLKHGLDEAYEIDQKSVRWKGYEIDGFRLPTEAEWEYACRAGTTGERYGELDEIAWHEGNSGGGTCPVGEKLPNDWGLHDTLGNVWEWCWDWWAEAPKGIATDPVGPERGSYRVSRGGSWGNYAQFARAGNRGNVDPGDRYNSLGFRLARTAP